MAGAAPPLAKAMTGYGEASGTRSEIFLVLFFQKKNVLSFLKLQLLISRVTLSVMKR